MTQSPSKIIAILTAQSGKGAELRALLMSMAPHCRAEPGNLRWDIWSNQANGDQFVLDELYVNASALDAHRKTPHYQAYLAKVPELAERVALVLEPVEAS
jgi:quinol monooxygenase YgiN